MRIGNGLSTAIVVVLAFVFAPTLELGLATAIGIEIGTGMVLGRLPIFIGGVEGWKRLVSLSLSIVQLGFAFQHNFAVLMHTVVVTDVVLHTIKAYLPNVRTNSSLPSLTFSAKVPQCQWDACG